MLKMSGDRKKEVCDEFKSFQLLVGPAGTTQLMQCEGDFPAKFTQAKAFCGTDGTPSKADRERKKLCRIAKSQVCLSIRVQMLHPVMWENK